MVVTTRAVSTAVLAAVLATAGLLSGTVDHGIVGYAIAVVAGLQVAALAYGWPVLGRLPQPVGSGAVIALAGFGSVAAVQSTHVPPYLRLLPIVFAFAVLLSFVNELTRRDGRGSLVESVAGTVAGVLLAVSASSWIAASRLNEGAALVVTGASALAAAAAVAALGWRGWSGATATAGAAVVAGGVVGAAVDGLATFAAVVLALAVGVLLAALHVLFDRLRTLRLVPASIAAIVMPVAVSGVIVYGVGRVLVG